MNRNKLYFYGLSILVVIVFLICSQEKFVIGLAVSAIALIICGVIRDYFWNKEIEKDIPFNEKL